MMERTRSNTPRIVELEAQIGKLVEELVSLVQPIYEDREDAFEDLREVGPEGMDDLAVCESMLDTREMQEDEEASSTGLRG